MTIEQDKKDSFDLYAMRTIVALDLSDYNEALALVDSIPEASYYKVGLEAFSASGPSLVAVVKARGKKVFVDLKLHDIPNTVEERVQ